MGRASFLQFWSIPFRRAVDGGVIDVQTPLQHDLFQVSIAQGIAQVPVDAQQNDIGLEMTLFEWGGSVH